MNVDRGSNCPSRELDRLLDRIPVSGNKVVRTAEEPGFVDLGLVRLCIRLVCRGCGVFSFIHR